eukprot:maker-scaffold_4-snap-gene-18.45-mRNA-1 protein AED:0.22 eAED:0.22 QI:40/1/1/1/1/1/2/174/290
MKIEVFLNNVSSDGKYVLGIDEAGRGPVLGPMVFGCVLWKKKEQHSLAKLGFNDSKVLTEERREELFEEIEKHDEIGFGRCTLSAEYISNRMLSPNPTNLNLLSFFATRDLLQKILEKVNGVELYVDAVGSTDKYQSALKDALNIPGLNITVAKKADSKYPVVSAASIVAKVHRDRLMWGLSCNCSGYPSDPNTTLWLKENIDNMFGFSRPGVVRFSWKTAKALINDLEEDEKPKKKSKTDVIKVVFESSIDETTELGSFFLPTTKLPLFFTGLTVDNNATETAVGVADA